MGSSEKTGAGLAGVVFAAVALLVLAAEALVSLVVGSDLEEDFAVFFGLRTAFMQAVALCL
jgi:hypothetical protein